MPDSLVQLVHLRVYFSPTGAVDPVIDFIVLPTTALGDLSLPDYLTLCMAVIFVFLLVNERREAMAVGLKSYLNNSRNCMDIAVYALGLIWCAMVVRARLVGWHRLNEFSRGADRTNDVDNRILNLWDVGVLYLHSEIVVSVALMVSQ